MKKNFITKLFSMTILLIICLMLFANNVKAQETGVIVSKSFAGEYVTEENLGVWNQNGEILEYDAKTGKTTVIDMEEVKRNAEQISKRMGFTQGTTKPFNSKNAQMNTRLYNGIAPLATNDFYRVENRLQNPYISICKVRTSSGASGTGFLVGPKLLLTSAHCVFNKDANDAYYTGWSVAPAYHNGLYNNLSSGWSRIIYPTAYLQTHKWEDDWCLCILGDDLGRSVGNWMGLSATAPSSSLTLKSVGYPTDIESAKYQYYSKGKVGNVSGGYFTLSYPLTGGMSGGPTFYENSPRIRKRDK